MTVSVLTAQLPAINADLAQYAELFTFIAALIYTLAFILFTIDTARSSATIRRVEAELAGQAENEPAAQSGHSDAGEVERQRAEAGQTEPHRAERQRADAHRAESVAAGSAHAQSSAGSTGSSGSGVGTAEPGSASGDVVESAAGVGRPAAAEPDTRVGPTAAETDAELVDDDMGYLGNRRPLANAAVALTIIAAAAHAFAVIARGIAASRWPLGNMYEFLVGASLVVVVVFLLSLIARDLRFLGVFVLGLVVTMMMAATVGFPTPVGHVQPALQSPWLAIHVTMASLAIGLFVLTFAMNLLQLVQSSRERALAQGSSGWFEKMVSRWQFMRLVPKAFSLESWAYRINAVGFIFWTLGPMITGAIWAQQSWGRYWGWDPKEVWTFVIWVVYAGYLHARATRGWTGNRAAWLSIIGFVCIIINYAVVNVYFPGLHSYAGLPE